ncbi:MAG: pantoate--beta-alanine ligase [Deltaproteobacteria bacterium]|nr:pantoate--beta-alanine ligase [Deltaproteobacteria bacterium]
MQILTSPEELRLACDRYRSRNRRVGLVPTMGALHQGHLSLVDTVRKAGATRVVLTIFVNPTQFGPKEDFERYPKTLVEDLSLCREKEVDLVFAPETAALYPPGYQTHVEATEITREFEGRFRPVHFRGVTTIVAKLFNLTGPCVAAFGRKDYQQWRVIETMTRDLNLPIEILGSPTVRESDGLAMSSRNRYLNPEERRRARAIYQGLLSARNAFTAGERKPLTLEQIVRSSIESSFDSIDYVSLADPLSLVPCRSETVERAVILVAAHLGATRLIDNTVLGEDDLLLS